MAFPWDWFVSPISGLTAVIDDDFHRFHDPGLLEGSAT
jgi:hypothetical protein